MENLRNQKNHLCLIDSLCMKGTTAFRKMFFNQGAVHKRRRHKVAKIDPSLLVCKMSTLAQRPSPSPLFVRTHHTFWKIRRFFLQKVRMSASEEPLCPQNVHTGQTPWLRTSFLDVNAYEFFKKKFFNRQTCLL